MEQFAVMRETLNWNLLTFEEESIHLADAAIMQFNHTFGHSAARLQGWQALCKTAELEFVPDDIDVCQAVRYHDCTSCSYLRPRQLLRDLNIDIFELVEASLGGGPLRSRDPALLLDGIGITDFHGLGRRELAGDLLRELSVLATEDVDPEAAEPVEDPWAIPDTGVTWDVPYVNAAWTIPDTGATHDRVGLAPIPTTWLLMLDRQHLLGTLKPWYQHKIQFELTSLDTLDSPLTRLLASLFNTKRCVRASDGGPILRTANVPGFRRLWFINSAISTVTIPTVWKGGRSSVELQISTLFQER
jgi:hypothetical protein